MSKKRIFSSIWLFLLLYFLSVVGYTFLSDDYLRANAYWLAIIDLAIWSVVLMIVPLIWRLVNKGKFTYDKGIKICGWNSFIIYIISISISEIIGFNIIGWLVALVFYFINYLLFVESKEATKKMPKCSNCNNIITSNSKYCPKCSFPIEDKLKKPINSKKETLTENFQDNVDNSDDLANIYNTGILNIQLRNYDTAKELFKKYIKEVEKLQKKDEAKWFTFNNCVELMLYIKESEDHLQNIVDVNYEVSNAYLNLASIDFECAYFDEAIKLLNKALKWNPNNVKALFEKAEIYKAKKDLQKFYMLTLDIYDKIYTISDLARYYRNLGYYFIEKGQWELAKTIYLYSIRFENNSAALTELKYIMEKVKDDNSPAKEDLKDVLKENRIPTFISKEVIKCINELLKKIIENNEEDTPVGKFLNKLDNSIKEHI